MPIPAVTSLCYQPTPRCMRRRARTFDPAASYRCLKCNRYADGCAATSRGDKSDDPRGLASVLPSLLLGRALYPSPGAKISRVSGGRRAIRLPRPSSRAAPRKARRYRLKTENPPSIPVKWRRTRAARRSDCFI